MKEAKQLCSHRVEFRITEEESKMIDDLSYSLTKLYGTKIDRSKVIKIGIKKLYDKIKQENN